MKKKIIISLILMCLQNYIHPQSNITNSFDKKRLTIPLADKSSINKYLCNLFFHNDEFNEFPIVQGNLFLNEDYGMLDTLYFIDSIKCATNYKAQNLKFDIYNIFYKNGFSEKVFYRIFNIANTMHNIDPYFEYFKRGNVILLDKDNDCVTYIIYNATQPILQQEIDEKMKQLKAYYDKIYKFPE